MTDTTKSRVRAALEAATGGLALLRDASAQATAQAPRPLRALEARARSAKQALLEKIVDRFFPTNGSGNNMSRG